MKFTHAKQRLSVAVAVSLSLPLLASVSAYAADSATATTAAQQQRLSNIKSKGDEEISRRLKSLSGLSDKINAATKLTVSDKATLNSEVSSEVSGLTALKSKLDGETTLDAARSDAQSIFNDYRVYALILPKVWLVRTADDQQVAETKLTALITKLQTRLNAAKSNGKEVTSLQNALNDMTTQVQAAQAISSSIEQKVISLQPSDYNSDHTVLGGDRDQLKTAQADNQKALSDAKTIVAGVKSL